MPKKQPRDDAAIATFAEELAGRWRQGDGIEPWLRSVEADLTEKVRRERWSWESIARALNGAGIVYQTGRPWTGASLLQKITSIRYEGRLLKARKAADPPAPANSTFPAPSLFRSAQTVLSPAIDTAVTAADDEPEFRPARFASQWSGWQKDRQPDPPPATKVPVEKPMKIDTAAVIARLLGKK